MKQNYFKFTIKSSLIFKQQKTFCLLSKGIFNFSFIWTIGGTTDSATREKFDMLFRELLRGKLTPETKQSYMIMDDVPAPHKPVSVPIPSTDDVYSWRFVQEDHGRFVK